MAISLPYITNYRRPFGAAQLCVWVSRQDVERRMAAPVPALDVAELLETNVRAKARLRHDEAALANQLVNAYLLKL